MTSFTSLMHASSLICVSLKHLLPLLRRSTIIALLMRTLLSSSFFLRHS